MPAELLELTIPQARLALQAVDRERAMGALWARQSTLWGVAPAWAEGNRAPAERWQREVRKIAGLDPAG